ncbi:MAG: class I adenylate-forming enzyme family protein [Alphaproteobacteria bacterium]
MDDVVPARLRRAAERRPHATVLVAPAGPATTRVSFAELATRAEEAAASLEERGLEPGDRVALLAGNGEPVVVAWFAIVAAGAVVVPISTVSGALEIAGRLDHARCRLVLHDAAHAGLASAAIAASRHGAQAVDVADLAAPGARPARPPIAPDAPAMILYTSGTTGRPRGVVIAHRALVGHTRVLVDRVLALGPEDAILGVLPLAHSYGCRMVMLASVEAGCRAILLPRFDPAGSLDAMIAERATWVPAVPTMYAAWAALPEGARPESLRWCMSAGSPLADETLRRAEARLGTTIRQAYGMTEATISTVDAPPAERVAGSVGRPVPGVEVRIVDDADRDVPPGAQGQVLLRGHNLMSGYLDDPDETASALRGGWMHTGDVGRLDADGRLFVVDRLKDMIIRGGNNVIPSEVEAALASHPGVREVAVVGRPDAYLGEEVVAVVVPAEGASPTPEELRDWAAARVASIKVPREYALVAELPLGPSRKVLKRELRERVRDGALATVRPEGRPGGPARESRTKSPLSR